MKLSRTKKVKRIALGLAFLSAIPCGTGFAAPLPSSEAFMRKPSQTQEESYSRDAAKPQEESRPARDTEKSQTAKENEEQARLYSDPQEIQENSEDFKKRIQSIIDRHRYGAPAPEQAPNEPYDHVDVIPKPDRTESLESYPQPHNRYVWDDTDASRRHEQSGAAQRFRQETETFDFDLQGSEVAPAIYAVAKAAGRDIVVNGELKGKVYSNLHNKTCSQALDYLARAFNFNWEIDADSDAIIISTSDLMMTSQVFRVHYLDKEKVVEELKAIGFDEERVYANSETGTVSVTGTYHQIQAAARRIKALDAPISQCLLVAQLIEVDHGKNLDLGFKYTLPTYSHTGTTDSYTTDENFRGNWLEKLTFSVSATANRELSKGRVIARPMVMVMNGNEGFVKFGDQVPIAKTTSTTTATDISVDYRDVGTQLKFTPTIDEATNTISLLIDTEVSNITQWRTVGGNLVPQISTRNAKTSARLHSGQSFVIGGLMSAVELDNLSGIPGLMNLPILGALFRFHNKSKTYSEVFIQITPYIITDAMNPKEILRQVDARKELDQATQDFVFNPRK